MKRGINFTKKDAKLNNQREWMNELQRKLQLPNRDDLKHVKLDTIRQHEGGRKLLGKYKDNLRRLLTEIYPNHEWNFITLHRKSQQQQWEQLDTQRTFFEVLKRKKQITNINDLLHISNAEIAKLEGGKYILRAYQHNKQLMLSSIYPSHDWSFNTSKHHYGYWKNISTQQQTMTDIFSHLNFTSLAQFADLSSADFVAAGGRKLLRYYRGNYHSLLRSVFPNFPWNFSFVRRPRGFWLKRSNQRMFIEHVRDQLRASSDRHHSSNMINDDNNNEEREEWREVRACDVIRYGGKGLLRIYKNDYGKLISSIYPSSSSSARITSIKRSIRTLIANYKIQKKRDWQRVATADCPNLVTSLRMIYPSEKWSASSLQTRSKRTKQRKLYVAIVKMIGDRHEVIENYQHPKLRSAMEREMELDIFIPTLSLAFEYQGEQHYDEYPTFATLLKYQENDQRKGEMSRDVGVRLIYIPFWYDMNFTTLVNSLMISLFRTRL